ncbi:hypothetical protein [Hoylesella nanceiensis]|uniref:hypothetical protein n=1 Tax=Hoylesella nanceiensis TaxID=425941 RepID=UPI001CB32E03|nr:hypothetical protein [Hoylesella nanceiensis]MBF1421938.1 hypothetical protein [Hoylesella nanceiensis]
MKKELLAALKAKFEGVNESILSRIADKLAKTTTKEEDVATAVSGVTIQQIIEGYGDSRATEAQQSAVRNYEEKYGLKDGERVQEPKLKPQEETMPEWAKQLVEENKTLSERLGRMDGERITAERKQKLSAVFKKLPENLRKPYERMSIDKLSDEDFTTLVGEITAEVDEIASFVKSKGAVFGRPAAHQGADNSQELSKEEQEAIASRNTSLKDGEQPF